MSLQKAIIVGVGRIPDCIYTNQKREVTSMNIKKLAALVAVSALVLTGCAATTAETETAAPTSDFKICVYTHGDGGGFWSVAQKGSEQAGTDLGVTVDYQGSTNDSAKQAQTIEAGIAGGCDAIAASAPDPDAIKDAMLAAAAAGIPTVTMNSGSSVFRDLGAITHVGQDEFIAGQEAGLRFKAAGIKKILCPLQEAANIGLEERCAGAQDTHGNVVNFNLDGGLADLTAASAKIKAALEADSSYDGVFALNADIAAKAVLPAVTDLGVTMMIGTVDMSAEALDAIKAGTISFAIDQQQYAQGYLSVALLYLNLTNGHTLGGGLPMYTGPGFVDSTNVENVIALVGKGTR
jgi:simple sugar transport system substrate-binding protein